MKFGNQDGTGFGFGSFGAGQTQAPPCLLYTSEAADE